MAESARPHVLVVGAGLTGLTMAHELARRGVRVRITDSAPGPRRRGGGGALRPRTVEIMDRMGLADLAARRVGPDRAEYSLRAGIARHGVGVAWGTELVGFTWERPQTLHATLRHRDGRKEHLRPGWLVGCDGRRGAVRGRLGALPHDRRVFLAGAATARTRGRGSAPDVGVEDAYNLAWKIAMVEQGHGGPALPTTYDAERFPKTAFPPLRARQRRQHHWSPLTRPHTLDFVPVYGFVGAAGPLVAPWPAPGDWITAVATRASAHPGFAALRDELRDTRWTLLLTAGAAQADAVPYAPWLSVRTFTDPGDAADAARGGLVDPGGAVRAALALAAGDWLLVRPDGYVSARGPWTGHGVPDDAEAALDYLRTGDLLCG